MLSSFDFLTCNLSLPKRFPRYNNSSTKSRLVREDENDGSDDEEETVQMAVPSAARDRDRKREAFMSVQNEDDDPESDKGEEDEWESQQIRKGVTGAQVRGLLCF